MVVSNYFLETNRLHSLGRNVLPCKPLHLPKRRPRCCRFLVGKLCGNQTQVRIASNGLSFSVPCGGGYPQFLIRSICWWFTRISAFRALANRTGRGKGQDLGNPRQMDFSSGEPLYRALQSQASGKRAGLPERSPVRPPDTLPELQPDLLPECIQVNSLGDGHVALEKGIASIEAGKGIPHEEARKRLKKWLSQ